jgi:hypothetical protein
MQGHIDRALLTGASQSNTSGQATLLGFTDVSVYISFGSAVTAGSVAIETSADGTNWVPLAVISGAGGQKNFVYQASGAFNLLRSRIQDAVVGGTVDVRVVAVG